MATMQNIQSYGTREVQKIDLSRIFFAFSALAFGTSFISVLVATLMPTSSFFGGQNPLNFRTQLLPSYYYTSSGSSWVISVSAYVFLLFPAIGLFCALLGVMVYRQDLLWRLAKDLATYFKVSKYLEMEGMEISSKHGQIIMDDANGMAMEIKEIANESDVRAVDDHIAEDLNSFTKEWPSMLYVVHDENGSIEKPNQFCSKYNKDDDSLHTLCIVIEQ